MPNARFYVRTHFHIPLLDPTGWRLNVGGLVQRPLSLSILDLRSMRSQTAVATLECAGNGRWRFHPSVAGEQWHLGAVSTAEWTGVPLVELLDRCGTGTSAREVRSGELMPDTCRVGGSLSATSEVSALRRRVAQARCSRTR